MKKRVSPEIKRLAHERARGSCERCGKTYNRSNWEAHVHHITYERLGNELLGDVVVLCLACHGQEHPRMSFADRGTQQRHRHPKRNSRQRGKDEKAQNAERAARAGLGRLARAEKRRRWRFGDPPL